MANAPATTKWRHACDTSADGTRCIWRPAVCCSFRVPGIARSHKLHFSAASFFDQGVKKDLNRSMVAVSLYCWIAPAGYTCLGQKWVHSPTNVHPHLHTFWASM